jgi:hypothetical protein
MENKTIEELGVEFLADVKKVVEFTMPLAQKWAPLVDKLQAVSPDLREKIESEFDKIVDQFDGAFPTA